MINVGVLHESASHHHEGDAFASHACLDYFYEDDIITAVIC